jgi:ABC-2 type transport system ATP-binding protein
MTAGRVAIGGHDIVDASYEARRAIGYMPEAVPLYPEMRVREYLRFRAELKGVSRKERVSAIGRSMESARVTDVADTLIGHLSKGYRQRVGLADALVANPPLLILDEPTAGLDPNQIREVRELVRGLGENHTILLSTHILPEVETTCHRALVIDRGHLVAEGTIDELRARRSGSGATIAVAGPPERATSVLEGVKDIASVRLANETSAGEDRASGVSRLVVTYSPDAPARGDVLERAIAALVAAGIGVREAAPERATLEDVFAELTESEESGTEP